MHEITLDGYAAQCAEQPIRLGTEGSYGVETLRVMRKGEWVDYDIIIAFHPPKSPPTKPSPLTHPTPGCKRATARG